MAIIAEMTQRQAEVQSRPRPGRRRRMRWPSVSVLGWNPNNDQRGVGAIIDRHAESAEERGVLLRKVVDLLHEGDERQ